MVLSSSLHFLSLKSSGVVLLTLASWKCGYFSDDEGQVKKALKKERKKRRKKERKKERISHREKERKN